MKKYFSILLFAAGLLLPTVVSAGLNNPYIVDEKPQVIFGDSVLVDGYFGLENYTHDYINNYLHITFTYTHAAFDTFCCTASTPPLLYITSSDPRATTTPLVRSQEVIYTLRPKPIPPGHPTDWYLYDVQFDATGYMVKVFQGGATTTADFHRDILGIIESDYASLANLFPTYGTFDGATSTKAMSFTPLPVRDDVVLPPPPDPIATTTPVIIVPGIISSILIDQENNEKWLNLSSMTLSAEDLYLNDLLLNENGGGGNVITADSIIKNIKGNDFFESLINNLEDPIEFPYDWRLDIQSTANDLKEKIDQIKSEKGVNKVNLVAHSMGGLLVKKYLDDFGGGSVEKFIDIGTPHTGAPKAFKILNYGDNFGFEKFGLEVLNSNRVKFISQNMPAVYQLLPSQAYFNDYEYYVFDAASGDDRLTFSQTSQYLKDSGRNANLVDRANALHQEIDDLDPTDYGVETYNFVGCGTPTIGQFYIIQEGEHPIYNIRMINGDGTVPLKSAEAISAKTYYVKGAQHALMPSTSGVKDVISQILTSTSTPDISPYSNLATTANGCDIPNGKIVSFHSPIELHVYDSSGNHSGPDNNGDIENEISGVVYEVIGDNKFAFLPDGANYQVQGVPADTGTFDVRIETVTDGEVSSLSYWNGLPVGGVSFLVGEEVPNTILDVPPSAVLNGVQALDLVKPVTELSIKGNKISEDSYISSVQFSLSATDDNAGVLKTEYSLDGGHTWDIYSKPVVVNEKGGVELMYRSVDKAGNVEVIKSKIINIIWPGNSGKKR